MSKVCIGIPCFQNAPAETLADYMRLAYYLGRRMPEHDFFLAIKAKTEQFRARNAIVQAALQVGSDFILMLDDDHVIDWEEVPGPNQRYGFLRELLAHMDADPQLGIVGALYYHRGGDCRPVLMKEGKDGADNYWMRDDEITGRLQEVTVTGGGAMLIRSSVFDRIPSPWFHAELDAGTDIQICRKVREEGFKVACDTSIVLGHVMSQRMVITPANRHKLQAERAVQFAGANVEEGLTPQWKTNSALTLYRQDVEEYLGAPISTKAHLIEEYAQRAAWEWGRTPDPKDYYRTRGEAQLVRQVWFHHLAGQVDQMEHIHSLIRDGDNYGLEVGCGSSPVGFEFVMRGARMDFIDVPGAAAYEFLKWRALKRGVVTRCGWDWGEEVEKYDFILMLDAIEHWPEGEWQEILLKAISRLKPTGGLVTNYFFNKDFNNPEHVMMDHARVQEFLVSHGIYPIGGFLWTKKDLGFMDKEKAA